MHSIKTLVVSATLAVFLSAITGAALADPGKGNPNAPGQQKAVAAAPTAAPAAAPAAKPAKPVKAKGGKSASSHQTANASSTTPGMKPANNTAKSTHCSTGGTASAPTCTATGSNTAQAQAKTDASKRYGNGQTAAQIAVSRGAPAGTDIYGPGNSQPHKVTDCKHKHGVDVHAVKSYSNAACTAPAPTESGTQEQKVETSCPGTTVTSTVTASTVKTQKGHAYGRLKHGKGLHTKTKTEQTTTSTFTPSGATCSSSGTNANANAITTATAAGSVTPLQTATQTPAAANAQTAAATAAAQGGVLGAQASKTGRLASTKVKPSRRGGVLGATGRAAHALGAVASRGTLPFTGFPLWAALVIGLGLVATGLTLRRRGRVLA